MQTFNDLGQQIKILSTQDNFNFADIGAILAELKPSTIAALLNTMLAELKIKGKLPTFSEDHIYLYREKEFNIFIRFAGTGVETSQLAANEFDAFILNLATETVSIPAYACDIDQQYLDQKPASLQIMPPIELKPHELYYVSAFTTILDLNAISKKVPLLIVHSEKRSWSTWSFDRKTRQPIQRFCTDLRASRLQLTLAFLQYMNNSEDMDSILTQLSTSDYAEFVRWDAIKYLYQIKPEKGLAILQQVAQHDVSSDLRNAAKQTLESINHG